MATGTWSILYFPKTNETSVAPSSWLKDNNTKCDWPLWKNTDRLVKAIETREEPEDGWKEWSCRIIGDKYFRKCSLCKAQPS